MPISMGILCERCRRVYFIPRSGKSARIHFDRAHGEFRLHCDPPCNAVVPFHRAVLKPYSIADESLELGYADVGQCQAIVRR
jgi:hypothetical protein